MAALIRTLGERLLRRAELPETVDPQGIALYRAFGRYFVTLPERWALIPGDVRTFRAAFPEHRVGDVLYDGGFFFSQLVALYMVGYYAGVGNRFPFSHRLTAWKPFNDRVLGAPGSAPAVPYGQPVPWARPPPPPRPSA